MLRFVLLLALLAASLSHGADYTRDGGTADWMCCTDKACAQVISQHADAVRAEKACGRLTDGDGITRYVRSQAFRITSSAPPSTPKTPTEPAPLTAPSSLTATPSGTSIRLAWSAVAGAAAYQVERCGNLGCTNFTPLWCHAGSTERSNTNLPPGTVWRYRVRASRTSTCGGDFGPFGPIATATVPTASIGLTWEAPEDAIAFVLHYGPTQGQLWEAVRMHAGVRALPLEPTGEYFAVSYQLPNGQWSEVSNVVRY